MPCPPHSPWFDHPNNIWWWVNIIKLLVSYSTGTFPSSVKNKPPSRTNFLSMTFRIITADIAERPTSFRINEVSIPLSFDRMSYKVICLADFDLIVLTVFGKEQYTGSPSLWSFLHPTVPSSCLSPTRSSTTMSSANLAGNFQGLKPGFCGEKPHPNRPRYDAA
jgi:hypothetical protein